MKKSRMGKDKRSDAGQTPTIPPNLKSVTVKLPPPMDSVSALNTTKKSLELVEWRDANFYVDEGSWDGDYINATVGWTEEDDTWLKISSELTPDGERAVTRVPLVNVVRRRVIKIVNWPSTWTTSQEPTE